MNGLWTSSGRGFSRSFPWMAAALGAAYTLSGRHSHRGAVPTPVMAQTAAMDNIVAQAPCRLSLEAQMVAGHLEGAAPSLSRRSRSAVRTENAAATRRSPARCGGVQRGEPPAVAQAEGPTAEGPHPSRGARPAARSRPTATAPGHAVCHGWSAGAGSLRAVATIDLYRTMDMPSGCHRPR